MATPGMRAIDVAREIFLVSQVLLMEFIVYQCEEKPHFAEAKKINPKAQRSVAKALQHTPDFTEPTMFIQSSNQFEMVRQKLSNLKEIDAQKTDVTSYLGDSDKPRVHEAIKMVSKVKTRYGIYHIPLLDLDIPVSENGASSAEEVFRELGVKHGAILNSGASYHGWGLDLKSEDEWRHFMAKALLLDRIDRRWVAHRLKDRQANIRVSPKWGQMPKVAYIF